MWRIHLLGDFHLTQDDTTVTGVSTPRLQSLLAWLVLHRSAPQSRRHLAFLLWPDSAEENARSSLRNLLHQLRQMLPDADQYITVTAQTIQWRNEAALFLDVAAFEEALARSWIPDGQRTRLALETALSHYKGDLLPGCYDEWVLPDRDRLRLAYTSALERLIKLLGDQHDYEAAILYAERLRQNDPLNEDVYVRLMRLNASSGRHNQVTRVYRDCADVMRRELGAEPSPATQALYVSLAKSPGHALPSPDPLIETLGENQLLGRSKEWIVLQSAWQMVVGGRAHIVLINGEAGIGKTHLAEEMLAWVTQKGYPATAAHCYQMEGGLAFAPLVGWLRSGVFSQAIDELDATGIAALSDLLPEIRLEHDNLPEPTPLNERLYRRRLFEVTARVILTVESPLILFMDDWQWSDRETLEWMFYLLHFAPHAPILILGTLRAEEAANNPWLMTRLTDLRARGLLTLIELEPLDQAATAMLAKAQSGSELDPAYVLNLYRETEGNPLFIVEMVRTRQHGLTPSAASLDTAGTTLPPKVQAIIESRLARLTPFALMLASAAAVIGRQFDLKLLASITGYGEAEMLQGMDELGQRRVVRELASHTYDFSHEKIREVMYAGLSLTRRASLHQRVGHILASQHTDDVEAISGQAAAHFERAGIFDQAVRFYARAAAHAAGLHAHYRAAQLYGRAIEVAGKLNLSDPRLADLYLGRGRMLELAGEYAEAVRVYRELETMGRRRNDKAMEAAGVAHLAVCYIEPSSTHDRELAKPLFERGLSLAREIGDHSLESNLWRSRMVDALHYESDEETLSAGEAAIRIARQHGLSDQLAYVLNDLAMSLRLSGHPQEGQQLADEARRLFEQMGNLPMLADHLSQQAWTEYHDLNFPSALSFAQECAALCRRIDNGWNLSLALLTSGLVQYASGEWGKAYRDFEDSIRTGEQAGIAISLTLAPTRLAQLLRDIGLFTRARELDVTAHAASLNQAPFFVHAVEANLAMDAFAIGDSVDGSRWLAAALARNPRGAIARAWLSLNDVMLAGVNGAECTGDWNHALGLAEQSLLEAQQRRLPVYAPNSLIQLARCLHATGYLHDAEARLRQAVDMARPAGMMSTLYQAHGLLAQVYCQQGRLVEAQQEQHAAAGFVTRLAESLADPAQRLSFLATPRVRAVLDNPPSL